MAYVIRSVHIWVFATCLFWTCWDVSYELPVKRSDIAQHLVLCYSQGTTVLIVLNNATVEKSPKQSRRSKSLSPNVTTPTES